MYGCGRPTAIALLGKTVTLKLKMVTFMVRQRSTTLSHPISQFNEIYQAASTLLAAEMSACSPSPLRIRLMGKNSIAFVLYSHFNAQTLLYKLYCFVGVRLSSLSSAESCTKQAQLNVGHIFSDRHCSKS